MDGQIHRNLLLEANQITHTTYSTKQIAALMGIHVNTVRFYEGIGFLSKPERRKNGYRVYTSLHLAQCRVIRLAMKAEILQNGLRRKAVEIVRLCASQDYDAAIQASVEYGAMIQDEISNAKAAIAAVEGKIQNGSTQGNAPLGRKDAAVALHVTPETLRTWERSGLIRIGKRENGYRVYSDGDMERLNIIRTLRCANYSLSAILRLMNGLEEHSGKSVETLLNVPGSEEDIVSVCDKLILSLESTASDAAALTRMISNMKVSTPQ